MAKPTPSPAATQHTVAGAEAFATYFMSLLDYGFRTKDTAPYAEASTKDCDTCQAQLAAWKAFFDSGGSYRGGAITVRSSQSPLKKVEPFAVVIVSAVRSPFIELDATDQPTSTTTPTGEATYQFNLIWVDNHWTVGDYESLAKGSTGP